jgi:hypothetical protein
MLSRLNELRKDNQECCEVAIEGFVDIDTN